MRDLTIIVLLSILFTGFSFIPTIYDIYYSKDLPSDRLFVLEHNYMFDYNFYLSRIRQGYEGRLLVTEKYYNHPHASSMIQIFYLILGKIGSIFGLTPPIVYHISRFLVGLTLLTVTGIYLKGLFPGIWRIVAFLFIVTAGSWPIVVKAGDNYRFATHMGNWSVIDSLQRITTIPHILVGQILLLLLLWKFSEDRLPKFPKSLRWGMLGLVVGIIFPPTLFIVYVFFVVSIIFAFAQMLAKNKGAVTTTDVSRFFRRQILPQMIFVFLSAVSLVYFQYMFGTAPWKALTLFDIEHRIPLLYKEYALALGPVFPLGILGGILVFIRREKKLYPSVFWIISIFLLFVAFERVPTQSPLRFTEGAIHIPLGILTAYFFYQVYQLGHLGSLSHLGRRIINIVTVTLISAVILLGLSVMWSMVLWLTDQVRWKAEATWPVPVGAQLAYPLKDFMDGILYLRDNTRKEDVVLAYITAGNFIPAYAGNYVYIGHANTPDEDGKEKIAARFFAGRMGENEAKELLMKERISYVYFGPQERALALKNSDEFSSVKELKEVYPFLSEVYKNSQVQIYRVF